jgi:hypothetical protein
MFRGSFLVFEADDGIMPQLNTALLNLANSPHKTIPTSRSIINRPNKFHLASVKQL